MNNKNVTSPHLLWHDSLASNLAFIGPIIALICSIICIIILNTHLKMLNEIFKRVINIVLVYNIISFAITLGINSYIVINRSQTFILCSIRILSIVPTPFLNGFGITIMSFLRYHISNRIVNCESTRKTSFYVTTILILFILFEWIFCGPLTFISVLFYNIPNGSGKCAGVSMDGWPVLTVVRLIKALVILITGIVYDYLMIHFLHKRNQKIYPGQAKLVPWKSGGQTYDFMVPITATITSTITAFVTFAIFVIAVKSYSDNVLEVWKFNSFTFSMLCSFQMSIMIGLTIRAAKHKKPAPIIPKGPQFHEPIAKNANADQDVIELQEIQEINDDQVESISSEESLQEGPARIIYVKPMIHHSECHI